MGFVPFVFKKYILSSPKHNLFSPKLFPPHNHQLPPTHGPSRCLLSGNHSPATTTANDPHLVHHSSPPTKKLPTPRLQRGDLHRPRHQPIAETNARHHQHQQPTTSATRPIPRHRRKNPSRLASGKETSPSRTQP